MKRMNLQTLGLSVNDLLSREQMKNVMGGCGDGSGSNGDGTCTVTTTCYDSHGRNTGSVSCHSDYNVCDHGNTWVSCDAQRTNC